MALVLHTRSMQLCATSIVKLPCECGRVHVYACACVWPTFYPAPETASAPPAFRFSPSNFSAIVLLFCTVRRCKMQLPSHLDQVVLALKQRKPKDSGTETRPDVKWDCGSLRLRFLPPWLPWRPRQRGDKSATPSPAYTASGESLQSYLLYLLHCRTAVDCCLTSTL